MSCDFCFLFFLELKPNNKQLRANTEGAIVTQIHITKQDEQITICLNNVKVQMNEYCMVCSCKEEKCENGVIPTTIRANKNGGTVKLDSQIKILITIAVLISNPCML